LIKIFSLHFIQRLFTRKYLLFFCGFIFHSANLFSETNRIAFQEKSWSEILRIAKKENKPVFVDAYTSWCGPCKKMVQDVFADSAVAVYFNDAFINYSINIETPDGKLFDSIFDVSAFPSLLFFGADGKLIFREIGYRSPEKLISLGESAKNNAAFNLMTKKMREGFENGTSDKHALYKYFIVLRDSGRTQDSVAAAIIKKLQPPDLKNDTAFNIWLLFDQRMNSGLLDYFIEQKEWFVSKYGKDGYDHKLNMIVSGNLVAAKKVNDLIAYEQLKAFIRRVYDGEEEQDVLNGADKKFYSK
jgi:thioredoxin 1